MKEKMDNIYTIPTESKDEPSKQKTSFFHINKEMIRFKAHFFLFIGAMGSILPFISVVARNRLELSATSLAAVLTATQFITIISKPIIGYLADYFNKLKFMINALIIIQTVLYFLILAIPPIKRPSTTNPAFQLTEQLLDASKNFEHFIVTIKSAQYCEFSETNSLMKIYSTSNETIDFERKFETAIVCVSESNKTSLICHQNISVGETHRQFFQTERNSCCIVTSSSNNIDNYLPDNFDKNSINLVSVKLHFTLQNLTEISPCSASFFKHRNVSDSAEFYILDDLITSSFWYFAILFIAGGICTNAVFTLGDTACCESVQKFKEDFGRQRLYGAVGWGVLSPIAGILCDLTNDYLAAWILMAVLQLVSLWNISKLNLVKPHFSQNILKDVGTVLKSSKFLVFELGVFMNGMGAGIMWFYLVWFLAGLGGSKFLFGLVQYVQCFAGEIPFMFFSGWIINKVGHYHLISLSLFCYAIRFIWYSYLQNPWLVLPIEFVHGFTYGTFYPTVASFGKLSAKPGTEATTQSVLFTTHEGLGAGLGCVLAGIGFDHFGGHRTFFYTGIFFFCANFLNIVNTLLLTRKHTKELDLTKTKSCK